MDTDGRAVDGEMNERTNGRMDGRKDGRKEECMHRLTDGWTGDSRVLDFNITKRKWKN